MYSCLTCYTVFHHAEKTPSSGLKLMVDSPPMSILEWAAQNAVWNITRFILEKLAKSLGVGTNGALYDLVCGLLKNILPEATEEELLGFMEKRGVVQPDPCQPGSPRRLLTMPLAGESGRGPLLTHVGCCVFLRVCK